MKKKNCLEKWFFFNKTKKYKFPIAMHWSFKFWWLVISIFSQISLAASVLILKKLLTVDARHARLFCGRQCLTEVVSVYEQNYWLPRENLGVFILPKNAKHNNSGKSWGNDNLINYTQNSWRNEKTLVNRFGTFANKIE